MEKSSLKYPQKINVHRMTLALSTLVCVLGKGCLLAGGLGAFTSCRTQYVAMPEIHTLYHHATDLRVDSTSRDRWHEVFTRGDTVFVHDSIDRWHYIFSGKTDTIHQRDSIPYPVEVPKYIRQRNWYDRFTARGFWVLLTFFLLCIITRIVLRR